LFAEEGETARGAAGGAGADSQLIDSVSGSTLGNLILSQQAVGGNGGSSIQGGLAGQAGDAASFLVADNLTGDNIQAASHARGGNGGDAEGPVDAQNGGTALSSIQLEDAGTVTASAVAQGGRGGNWSKLTPNEIGKAGDGGLVEFDRISGNSTLGGSVVVQGEAIGGNAGNADGLGWGGQGASVLLSNAVTGSTSGSLRLIQVAKGGDGGDAEEGLAGSAGVAISELEFAIESASLYVETEARGGEGGGTTGEVYAEVGGAAEASARSTNFSGSTTASAKTVGGKGGSAGKTGYGGNGADATSFAHAIGGENVFAMADSTGGQGAGGGKHGAAVATAIASGSNGAAAATARTTSDPIQVTAQAQVPVGSTSAVNAWALVEDALPDIASLSTFQAVAVGNAFPNITEPSSMAEAWGNMVLGGANSVDSGSNSKTSVMSASFNNASSNTALRSVNLDEFIPLTFSMELTVDDPEMGFFVNLVFGKAAGNINGDQILVFFESNTLVGEGFNQLNFTITGDQSVIFNKTFLDSSEATDFFSQNQIFLSPIPEPAVTVIMGLGGLGILYRRVGRKHE
jgi:hypothetical protein